MIEYINNGYGYKSHGKMIFERHIITVESLAVFTLEDEQIVWTDKSSQTDKSSDVKTGRTNFQTTLSTEFVRLFVRL